MKARAGVRGIRLGLRSLTLTRRLSAVLFMVSLGTAPATATQEEPPSPRAGDNVGWHEVKPGETLQSITQGYLGSVDAWRDNWRLNPDLPDPHLLLPGQRIRVILSRRARTAEVKAVSRKVEERSHPQPAWEPARVGDQLKERDGLRTYERSSSELLFDDGARLRVGEQSILFIRALSAPPGPDRKSLEIVEGQADIEVASAAKPSDIEVVMGGVKARTRRNETGEALSRGRKTGAGAAQVMVFRGAGDVEAAGATVEVLPGMGTSVPKGGRPTPPEPLLPAPRPLGPGPAAVLNHANPTLSWTRVPGAASYTIEVCRDPACAELVDRMTGLKEPRFQVDGLPLGEFYRRAVAVSASGLDGFASEPATFSIRSLWRRPSEPGRRSP